MKKDLPDLTKLTWNELLKLYGDIMNEAYFECRPIANEMEKRYLEQKKKEEEQNLKKAS